METAKSSPIHQTKPAERGDRQPRRVIIESPYAGKTPEETQKNVEYARACLRDSLMRGEAPFASHLLYTQEGVLDDTIPNERIRGILAGFAWRDAAERTAVYIDLGVTEGMSDGIEDSIARGVSVEYRMIPGRKREPTPETSDQEFCQESPEVA